MRRMEHEIIFPWLNRLGFQLHYSFFASLLCFALPIVLLDVFVAHSLWATECTATLKIAIGTIHSRDVETGVGANDVLFNTRAVSRSIKLLLVHKSHRRVYEVYTGCFHRRRIQRQ